MALVIAIETIHAATKDGVPRTIHVGTSLDASDPIVKACPRSFSTPEEVSANATPPTFAAVEQATAAPGDRRTVKRG